MLHPLPVTKQVNYVQGVQLNIPSNIKLFDKLEQKKMDKVCYTLWWVSKWWIKAIENNSHAIKIYKTKQKWTGSVAPSGNRGCLEKRLFASKMISVFDPLYQNSNHKHITTNINSEYSMVNNWILNVKNEKIVKK